MGDHGRHVKWREEELAKHDETRGTREVIDQPDTPYLYHDSDAEEIVREASVDGPQNIDMGYLRQRLGVAETLRQAEEETDMAELKRQEETPVHHTLFEMKRKAFMDEQAKSLMAILGGTARFDDEEEDDSDKPVETPERRNHKEKKMRKEKRHRDSSSHRKSRHSSSKGSLGHY